MDSATQRNSEPVVVVVVDYDPEWPARFAAIRDRIAPALGAAAQSIEHVGSTSVEGLAAKPVIDIDVVVADATASEAAIRALETLGYRHRGNLGIADREAMLAPEGSEQQHLYVCLAGGLALRNHLAIRDHLRSNASSRAAYDALKRRLAREALDRESYGRLKTELVISMLRVEGFDDDSLAEIEVANR